MSFLFNCPNCGKQLRAQDDWNGLQIRCPHCKNVFNLVKPGENVNSAPAAVPPSAPAAPNYGQAAPGYGQAAPGYGQAASGYGQTAPGYGQAAPTQFQTMPPQPPPPTSPQGLQFIPMGTAGKFNIIGNYAAAWAVVRQVMQECEVRIKEDDIQKGRIIGNLKYGINAFGIKVTAVFYSNGNSIILQFSASLTDAFDTMGVCSKKIKMLSERLIEYQMSGRALNFAGFDQGNAPIMPPPFSQRCGESFKGKASVALAMGIAGLLVPILGIMAVIFAQQALTGMGESGNKEGHGSAVAGLILGFIGILIGVFLFLIMLNA